MEAKELRIGNYVLARCEDDKSHFEADDFVLNQFTLRVNKCIVLKIKHVHHLQNTWFALKNEELTIKN